MTVIRDHKTLWSIVLLFSVLAVLVTRGITLEFDSFGVVALRGNSQAGDALTAFISNFTHLGDSITLAIVAIATLGILVWKREKIAAKWFVMAASGSFIITALSKWAFGRDRPEVVEQFASATSGSFPSGHTLRSAVIYALLAFIITRARPGKGNYIIYVAAAAVIIVNGVSRVYLGVHWPTDVIGAWLIAGFWLLLCKNGYDRSCAKRADLPFGSDHTQA